MTNRIGILALVALQAFTASALPPCVCTRNLRPVCGSDGNTYANECILNCEKDKGATELTIDKQGPCQAPSCICTLEYKPVCGNDGNTYPNRCSLLCQRSAIPTIDVVSESACSDEVKVAEPPCICTEGLDYVCGSDGNTYDNTCVLNCATAKDSKLSINHRGRCNDAVKVAEPLCFCTDDLRPVCGSDGNTYDNSCALNCATAKDSKLSINHQGRCNDAVKVAEPLCLCTDDLRPVCGSDGNTYDNACALNCATAKDPSLSIKYGGKCEDSFQVLNPVIGDHPSCSCPRNIKPVCGSDGNTYQNACLLECAGGEVTLARQAPCYARG